MTARRLHTEGSSVSIATDPNLDGGLQIPARNCRTGWNSRRRAMAQRGTNLVDRRRLRVLHHNHRYGNFAGFELETDLLKRREDSRTRVSDSWPWRACTALVFAIRAIRPAHVEFKIIRTAETGFVYDWPINANATPSG